MKKLKEVYTQLKTHIPDSADELNSILWKLICYSPKMPLRLHQEQLINEATKFSLTVNDEYYEKRELIFNGFKWGKGKNKVLITHGWASKAADFSEIITAIKDIVDVEIIAFDAPGNGSSEGELSSLILFVEAIKAIINDYGRPNIVIGHSLGSMANAIALRDMHLAPNLLISLTPLVRLKENFEATMNSVEIPLAAQNEFFISFEAKFKVPASYFNLNDQYAFDEKLNHWLAYDSSDQISPYAYVKEFLDHQPTIQSQNYPNVGHDRILKSSDLIRDLVQKIKASIIH